MSTPRIGVLVVDDHADVASATARLLDEEPDLRCAGVLHEADRLPQMVAEIRPSIVLLDLTMPGRDPLAAMGEALEHLPHCRFIVVSGYDDAADMDRAFDQGAWGFVSKHLEFSILLTAIRTVAAGTVFRRGMGGVR